MTQDDRIAFSLKIVNAAQEIGGLTTARSALSEAQVKVEKLDIANKNLYDPSNALINSYQAELQTLSGIQRTSILEQDIQDSGGKKLQNHFFPNDTTTTVPSLAPYKNIWSKVKPYALTYSIGKNYVEAYLGTVTKELDVISAAQTIISSLSVNLDVENTSGQHLASTGGTCSLLTYTTQATCEAAVPTPGVWTPGISTIQSFPAVVAINASLIAAIGNVITFLTSEAATITTTDKNNAAQNSAAASNIASTISTLNAWLAYPDFVPVPGTVLPAQFNAYDSSLLAPTKLHSTQLTALQTALSSRTTFATTRAGQLSTVLGSISQDLTTGELISQTGLYGRRYNFMTLRLNALGGSLTQLLGFKVATGAQDSIKANIISTNAIYLSIIPTSPLKANASGGTVIHVLDPSFLSVGDAVYIYAENQVEIQRAVRTIQGGMITLNDIVPAIYRISDKARIYKDLS